MAKAVIACDLGASSGRLILGIHHEGQLKLEEVHRFPTRSVHLLGTEYWNILDIFAHIKNGLRNAYKHAAAWGDEHHCSVEIEGIGIDTWGVDYAWLSEDGELLANPVCYRDPRCEAIIDEVHTKLPYEKLFSIGGNQHFSFNTVYQLYYDIHVRGMLERGGKQILWLPNLLAYFLTGEKAYGYSIASTGALCDAETRAWCPEIFDCLGIPQSIVGELQEPGTRIGVLREEIAKELEIPQLSVMLSASHDSAGAIAAAPLKGEDSLYFINGTWSLIGCEREKPLLSPEAFKLKVGNEGGVDKKTRSFMMMPGLWMIQQIKASYAKQGKNYSYDDLSLLAEGSESPTIVDLSDERFLHCKDMRQEITAYCIEKGLEIPSSVQDFAHIAYASICAAYKHAVKSLEVLSGHAYTHMVAIGGGIYDTYLCQQIANTLGTTLYAGPAEASAMGNCITQLVALGELESFAEARELVRASTDIIVYNPKEAS